MQDQTRRTFSPLFHSLLLDLLAALTFLHLCLLSQQACKKYTHTHTRTLTHSLSLRLCIINETGSPRATRNSCCTKTLPSSSGGTGGLRKAGGGASSSPSSADKSGELRKPKGVSSVDGAACLDARCFVSPHMERVRRLIQKVIKPTSKPASHLQTKRSFIYPH